MEQSEENKNEHSLKIFTAKEIFTHKDLKAFFESEEFKTWLKLAEKPYHGKKPE